ncbi:ribonuclease HI family protein [Bacillus stercoris]|nr:ribonuclease HI family protein [Bacillus stercoris]
MEYKINYNMAVELIRNYLEKIYKLNETKETSPVKIQHLYELNEELRKLVEQLKTDGHNVDLIIRKIKEEIEPKYRYDKLIVYIDGSARGNHDTSIPNESASGFIIFGDSQEIHREAKYLGSEINLPYLKGEDTSLPPAKSLATNNTAEYVALIEALEYMLRNDLTAKQIKIYTDSNAVCTQVNMNCSTKTAHLIRLRDCARELIEQFDNIKIVRIPREENNLADALVNEFLDNMKEDKAI